MHDAFRFSFSRVVDIRSIAEPCADMLQAVIGGQDVVLDLSAVEEADLTLIQAILSARISAAQNNTSLALAEPASEAVVHLLERGGLIGPAPDARRDFWLAA